LPIYYFLLVSQVQEPTDLPQLIHSPFFSLIMQNVMSWKMLACYPPVSRMCPYGLVPSLPVHPLPCWLILSD
jgi:hypothetical protein